ncbi:MAG: HDOD domain-containing protein [Deltaproteobacteria bacterium]|nr:HDOD domain-containing protein [Deltaproteobacteria bacterium]
MVFGFFFSDKNASNKKTKVSLPSGVRSAIINTLGSRVVPSLPANAQKAFLVASNPKSDLRDIQEIIEADESFSSRLLKIANSVYFDRGKKAKTVPEALVIIGLSEAKTFLSSTYMTEIFSKMHGLRALLWNHNIAVAILAKWLNSFKNEFEPDLAFLAGLMHDIGKLMMHIRLGSDYERIIEKASRSNFIEAEAELFPFDHTDVGLLIAEEWNFSEELKNAIKFHHAPFPELKKWTIEWLVRLADTTAHAIGIAHPRGFYKFQQNAKSALTHFWDEFKGSFASLSDFLAEAEENYAYFYDLYGN